MDEIVHFHSRPATMRRLCFYFFLIILAGVLLLPGHSTGIYDSEVLKSGPNLELAVCHLVEPGDLMTANTASRDTSRLENVKSRQSDVRVKVGYHTIIQQAGRRHGVEAAMIKAIIMAESSYNPRAISSRGAAGLMQLMPITADSMGVKDRFDPEHNIEGGVRYFKRMLIRFDGDTRLALAAYNAGARKVRHYNGIPPYKTTRTYIDKVFQYYERYKDLENDTSKKV